MTLQHVVNTRNSLFVQSHVSSSFLFYRTVTLLQFIIAPNYTTTLIKPAANDAAAAARIGPSSIFKR